MRRIGCSGVLLGLLALFIFLFLPETLRILEIIWKTLLAMVGVHSAPSGTETGRAILVLCFNCCGGFLIVLLLWSFLAAPAVLPIHTISQRILGFIYFLFAILGLHGPRVLIRHGRSLALPAGHRRLNPGTVVIDPHSAAVLETRILPSNRNMLFFRSFMRLLELTQLMPPPQPLRVIGPGLTFTHPGEQLRDAVDLRRQFRLMPNAMGYTREGIELTTNIWCIFSIGLDINFDVQHITYVGEPRAENLRIVTLENLREDKSSTEHRVRIARFSNELDAVDREEIHQVARQIRILGELVDYQPLPPFNPVPQFNPQSVFAAVIHQPREGENVRPWTSIPTEVGRDIYREVLSRVNYDNLYRIDLPDYVPVEDLRREFRTRMIQSGRLAYRLVFHLNRDEQLREGEVYDYQDLLASPITELRNHKVLRDRGIRVIFCGFGDLRPEEAVYQQRLESWQVQWQRDAAVTIADHDLEAARQRNHARAQGQRDLAFALEAIFRNENISDEVMAVRLMQALERAASDPRTRQLMPMDTFNLLRGIHDWMLPGDSAGPPQQPPPPRQGKN